MSNDYPEWDDIRDHYDHAAIFAFPLMVGAFAHAVLATHTSTTDSKLSAILARQFYNHVRLLTESRSHGGVKIDDLVGNSVETVTATKVTAT